MDKTAKMLLGGGIILAIVLAFVSIYLAGIVFVIIITLVISQMIMQDSSFQPDITAKLREDAKAIVLTNTGNAVAGNIHVAIVPMDLEYDVPLLAVEASYEYPLKAMAGEIKVVLTYENDRKNRFTGSFMLSSMNPGYDPLKPVFPLFGWKKN